MTAAATSPQTPATARACKKATRSLCANESCPALKRNIGKAKSEDLRKKYGHRGWCVTMCHLNKTSEMPVDYWKSSHLHMFEVNCNLQSLYIYILCIIQYCIILPARFLQAYENMCSILHSFQTACWHSNPFGQIPLRSTQCGDVPGRSAAGNPRLLGDQHRAVAPPSRCIPYEWMLMWFLYVVANLVRFCVQMKNRRSNPRSKVHRTIALETFNPFTFEFCAPPSRQKLVQLILPSSKMQHWSRKKCSESNTWCRRRHLTPERWCKWPHQSSPQIHVWLKLQCALIFYFFKKLLYDVYPLTPDEARNNKQEKPRNQNKTKTRSPAGGWLSTPSGAPRHEAIVALPVDEGPSEDGQHPKRRALGWYFWDAAVAVTKNWKMMENG